MTFQQPAPRSHIFRTYVLELGGTQVECNPMSPSMAARIATLASGLVIRAPGARTKSFAPEVAAVSEDLQSLHQLQQDVVDDVEAREDVLTNDLDRHLDQLLAERREALLGGTVVLGEADNKRLWAVYLIVPRFVEACTVTIDLPS